MIDILFLQPKAATFLTKILEYYISETFKDEKEVEKIAERFKESDFEIPVLFSEIISSESFWDIKYRNNNQISSRSCNWNNKVNWFSSIGLAKNTR